MMTTPPPAAAPVAAASRSRHPRRHLWRCTGAALLAAAAVTAVPPTVARAQQVYTLPTGGSFSNPLAWNFGAGPAPASDPALTLRLQIFGGTALSASNDFNLTLNSLDLAAHGSGALTLAGFLGGNFAFAGEAAEVNLLGAGAQAVVSAPVTLAQGLTSLTFDGAGASGVNVSGVISSNTSAAAEIVISTDARNAGTGVVQLGGANTFAGGVTLNAGTLSLNSARALGDRANVLTINGGSLREASSISIANDLVLNSALNFNTPSSANTLTLTGVLSGAGGVNLFAVQPGTGFNLLDLRGVNTYSGATVLASSNVAQPPGGDGRNQLRVGGAVGSIFNTSGITVSTSDVLDLSYGFGASGLNGRVSTGTAIDVRGGVVQVVGHAGLVKQNLGTVTASGAATLLANTGGANAGTEITVANLVRGAGGTVVFQGPNLGGATVVPGLSAAQGNLILTQINGSAATAALVGGGGPAGTTNLSILPWAVGDTNNSNVFNVGSGFVTYGANGVRLLNATSEYNTTNNFTSAATDENMRVTGAVTPHAAAKTVNSLFFANTGQTLAGGANALTITSGALASNIAAATISNPVLFGAGGAGEGVVTVVDALAGATNNLTLSGGFTAASLVKSGHGDLSISSVDPTITGGAITINGGEIRVDAVSRLGGATGITVNGSSQAANRAGLAFTHTSGTQTLATPITVNAGTASISTMGAATLQLDSNISGSGGVTYNVANGNGFINVAGNNTYSGPTFLASTGTIRIDGDGRLGSSADPLASFLNLGGGTIVTTANWTSARALNVSATSTIDTEANTTTLSGPITGTGTLIKRSPGTLVIGGAGALGLDSSYSGTLQLGTNFLVGGTLALSGNGALQGATVQFGQSSASPAGTYVLDLSAASDSDPSDGSSTPWRSLAALNTASGFAQAHSVQLGSAALAPVDLRVAGGTFGGTIAGFGKVVKVGPGTSTLTLGAASGFTGGVEIWGGTLAFNADSQLGATANTVTILGGTLSATGNISTSRGIILGATPQPILTANGTAVTLANTINTSGPGLGLTGVISGSGGFQKTGATTLGVTNAMNSFSGDVQVSAGVFNFDGNGALGAAGNRLRLNGGTLQSIAASGPVTVNRTVITTANTTLSLNNGGVTVDLAGPILGTNTITKSGGGPLTISGNNTSFFGTLSATAGDISLASSGQLRRATVNIGSGTTFDLSGLTRELGIFGGTFASGSTLALGNGGSLTTGFNNAAMSWAGNVTGNSAASVLKAGTGTLTLQSNGNAFGGGFHILSGASGATTFNGNGTLPLQSALTLGAWGSSANAGPRLLLDNTATDLGTRLADTQVIHSHAGEIQFTTNTTTASSETIGSLRGAGMSTITMTTGGTLNFGDATAGLQRLHGGTFLVRAASANIGSAPATTGLANVKFGNLGAGDLIGGGGVAGTTTQSILPYVIGDAAIAGVGTNHYTYDPANGLRLLQSAGEYNAAINAVGATENVRLAPSALTTSTLDAGADTTINALVLAGPNANTLRLDSPGTEKLIVTSGSIIAGRGHVYAINAAGTAGLALGIQTPELQTGAGNTRELILHTGNDLAVGAKITTSGGLTKAGAGQLFLTNSANTYTGATTINAGSLVIDSFAALGGSTALQMGGGFLKYRGGDVTLAQSVLAAGGEATVNERGGSAGFDIVSGTTLTAPTGAISGFGGVLKDGTGVLKLTGTNTFGGPVIIGGGALAIDGAAALGTNGRVVFANGISAAGGQALRFDAPGITLAQDFIVNSAQAGVGFGFDTNGHNATLTGTLLDARSASGRGLYKFGAGNLTLTATQMYSGATQIFGGSLTLGGANGSLLNSTGTGGFTTTNSVMIAPRALLVLDNGTANNNNRLPDVWDTPFGTGNAASGTLRVANGELKIIGHSAGTQERINQLQISFGTITLQNGGGGTQLVSGLFNPSSFASAGLIRGGNLGAAPGPGSTNWFVTDLGGGGVVGLVGAGGAEGTPFVNLLGGFMSDPGASGVGTELTTYSADTGFRPLAASEYASTLPANNFDPNRAPNVALTAAATLHETTQISALKLGAGSSLGGGGRLLLGARGTVLATGNATLNVSSIGTYDASAPALNVLTPGAGTTLTVDSSITIGRLSKMGEGTLALNGRHLGGNFIAFGEGTLRLDSAQAALNPLIPLIMAGTGTLDLGGHDRFVGDLVDDGNITAGIFYSGQRASGTVALGANRLTLYDPNTGIYSGEITGTGGLTKAFFSTGLTTFTQPLAYTGATVIRAGQLQLAGAGTLASTSLEIRGGTLTFNNTDDNAADGYVANRLPTSTPITWAGGGITFTENANTPANHHLGATTIAGGNTLSINNNSATAPSTTTFANLIRGSSDRGTLTITATNLGLAPSPAGNGRVFATQIDGAAPSAALIGAGGPVGSTTQSILPWGWSSNANSFLTYGADGFRPLSTTSEYATTLGANATDNVRTTAAVTLGAAATANSLNQTTGNISGAFDLTLTSGALAVTAGVTTIGVNTNALLTGADNTRELVLYNLGITTLNYNVTTSGGVTKFGSAALTLGGANNSFTGGLTINEGTVNFSNHNQLGASGGAIRFAGIASSSSTLNYSGSATLDFNRSLDTVSFALLSTGAATTRWRLNGDLAGAGGLGVGSGIFEFNGANNTYAGPTRLGLSSISFINGDASLGSGGELILNGGTVVPRGDWTSSRLVHIANTSTLVSDRAHTTWSGQLIGTSAFGKTGAGNLTLTEPAAYAGTLTHSAGALVLRDRGSLALATVTAAAGATVLLDDTGAHFSDRLNDTATLTLAGGHLAIQGSAGTTTEEVLNTLALNAGANTVTLTPSTGQAAILRLATSATSAPTAATLFRGTNLGVNAPGTADTASIVLTNLASQNQPASLNTAVVLTGGLAPAGHPSIGIIKGGFGDTTATGLGTQLVTYDLDKGVRLLDPNTEYTTALANGSIVTDNVKADGTALALANATTANALWLTNGGSVTGAGTLTLSAATLLATGVNNTVANPLASGTNALAVGGPGDLTLSGALSGTGGLIKLGAGTLTLPNANAYTGATILAAGTVAVGSATSFGATAVQFLNGTLQNGAAGPLTLANNLTLNGTMRVGGTQPLTFSGTVSLANATRKINVLDPAGVTTLTGVVSSSLANVQYGLTKAGPGHLVLAGTAANPFDGPTTIKAGTLEAGATGALGATASITVNPGGTLLFSNAATTNRLNDSAPVTLAGGTLHTGGRSEVTAGTPGVGALTLAASSLLDLGAGASILHFADSSAATWTVNQVLTIQGWSGTMGTGGGTDQVLFGTSAAGLTPAQLDQVIFDLGGGNLFTANILPTGEIVPGMAAVPEPGTWLAGAALAAVLGGHLRRRQRQSGRGGVRHDR